MSTADDARPRVERLRPDELERLPIFPLPGVVFFPGSTLPLRLFEPRYRAMIEACMDAGPKAIVMALLRDGWEEQYEGRPPIHAIGGAGRIIRHEKMSDGTHEIVLTGTERVRIHEQPDAGLPYRLARCEPIADAPEARTPSADVSALWACASQVAGVIQREHPEFALGAAPTDPPGAMADAVADRMIADVVKRQEILETLDPAERVRRVMEAIGELLARITPHGPLS